MPASDAQPLRTPDPATPDYGQMPVRRFGRINWLGTATLAEREIRRFMSVWQ